MYNRYRRILCLAAVLGLLAAGLAAVPQSEAEAKSPEEAGSFLISLTTKAIEKLTDETIPVEQRKLRFRALFRENFDIPSIGRFVLGRYGRGTQEQVMNDFLAAFEDVMVDRFAPQFAGYGDTRFRLGTVRTVDNRDQFIVSSAITPPGSETEVKIDWRIRHTDGQYKVLDIIGEGVSMALTLRAEYGSVLKASGGKVDRLIALLRERIGSQAAAAN